MALKSAPLLQPRPILSSWKTRREQKRPTFWRLMLAHRLFLVALSQNESAVTSSFRKVLPRPRKIQTEAAKHWIVPWCDYGAPWYLILILQSLYHRLDYCREILSYVHEHVEQNVIT